MVCKVVAILVREDLGYPSLIQLLRNGEINFFQCTRANKQGRKDNQTQTPTKQKIPVEYVWYMRCCV